MTEEEKPAKPVWSAQRVHAIVETHRGNRAPLLPILHALADEFGYIDSRSVPVLAQALNLSRAEVHGVISFYRDFRTTPPGRTRVTVCRAEACQSVGANALLDHAARRLGVAVGQTSPDGAVSLDEVFCLGNCALGPTMTIGPHQYGLVDPTRFDALIDNADASPAGQQVAL